MTSSVAVMIIIGIVFIFVSFFVSEKITKREDSSNIEFPKIDEDYEFSERELQIIKRKIEDVIVNRAKDILYETNESLSSMANEKTMALGDYAVTVCDEIERNHKEVMFLYSMLDDKQKEIMDTVRNVDEANREVKELLSEVKMKKGNIVETKETGKKKSGKKKTGIDQLTSLKQMKENLMPDEITVNKPDETLRSETSEINVGTKSESAEIKEENEAVILEENKNIIAKETESVDINVRLDKVTESSVENENSNEIILELYRDGNSIIEIAKQLGLGVGEVKLVIDLYRGEEK